MNKKLLSQKAFVEGLKELEILFDFKFNQDQLKLWYKYLGNLTDAEFKNKIERCIKFCRRKPTIADVLDLNREDKMTRANAAAYIMD